jgi:phosphomevalonate kinase
VIATAPGKLILTGEYAVLDGAPALVLAINRRVVARRKAGPVGSSVFLVAVAEELARRRGPDDPAVKAAMEIAVDSSALYDDDGTKLGLGSSAAVTVAATALALSGDRTLPVIDREEVMAVAMAAHAVGQAGRGSGADVAAAVHGNVIHYAKDQPVERLSWPKEVTLIPFFTGIAAKTTQLIAKMEEARARDPAGVDAALAAIAKASRAACQACAVREPEIASNALLAALALAAHGTDQLAAATGMALVPPCVTRARDAMSGLGGTAKTTGAGGGDVAIAVLPAREDVTIARRLLIEAGCQVLDMSVDQLGVDLQPDAS